MLATRTKCFKASRSLLDCRACHRRRLSQWIHRTSAPTTATKRGPVKAQARRSTRGLCSTATTRHTRRPHRSRKARMSLQSRPRLLCLSSVRTPISAFGKARVTTSCLRNRRAREPLTATRSRRCHSRLYSGSSRTRTIVCRSQAAGRSDGTATGCRASAARKTKSRSGCLENRASSSSPISRSARDHRI